MDKLAIPERLRVASSKPVEGSYPSNANTQTESLRKKIQAPLYDPHDPEIVKAYQSLAPDQTAKPIDRDLLGEIQIISAVDDFKRKYPDHKILVVYSGAGRHNWLAVPELQRRGFTYSPTALQPMNGSLLDKSVEQPTSEPERTQWRQAAIKNQLGAEQRVLNALGYSSYSQFYNEQSVKIPEGNDLYVAIEETGWHGATSVLSTENGRDKFIYQSLDDYVAACKKNGEKIAVLYLGEGLYAANMRHSFDTGSFRSDYPRDLFLKSLYNQKIPVGFAGVTYENSVRDGTF
ncbi:MAG: hypothetical protein ACK4VS_00300 [Burkholderiales bacterium]|jgi:hypothetical protein